MSEFPAKKFWFKNSCKKNSGPNILEEKFWAWNPWKNHKNLGWCNGTKSVHSKSIVPVNYIAGPFNFKSQPSSIARYATEPSLVF